MFNKIFDKVTDRVSNDVKIFDVDSVTIEALMTFFVLIFVGILGTIYYVGMLILGCLCFAAGLIVSAFFIVVGPFIDLYNYLKR